jgi:hypothetical protein
MSASAAATHVEASVVPTPTRTAHALMLKVRVDDSSNAADAVQDVADAFKREHAKSGVGIRVLVVTLVGAMGATAFATGWRALERNDQALGRLSGTLAMAEVMCGAPSGQVLERASLRG